MFISGSQYKHNNINCDLGYHVAYTLEYKTTNILKWYMPDICTFDLHRIFVFKYEYLNLLIKNIWYQQKSILFTLNTQGILFTRKYGKLKIPTWSIWTWKEVQIFIYKLYSSYCRCIVVIMARLYKIDTILFVVR